MSSSDLFDNAPDAANPSPTMRKLTGAQALRALAHPTRVALLEAVGLYGPLTATEAAAMVGGTASNVSYHLRTLAKYEYVVELEGRNGRERPWKLVTGGLVVDSDDPDTGGRAADALSAVFLDRWLSRAHHYKSHREQYPEHVRAASGSIQSVVFATAAEIEQAQSEIADILARFENRTADPAMRPEGALPFEVLVSAHPFEMLTPTDPER